MSSVWHDEADFLKDIEGISEFYIKTDFDQFSETSSRKNNKPFDPWYDSDSEEEFIETKLPDGETDHLQIMREVQMQVRSVVGNCYSNDAIEAFYRTLPTTEISQETEDNPPVETDESEINKLAADKENEQIVANKGNMKKNTVAENIENTTAKLHNPEIVPECSTKENGQYSPATSSPQKGNNNKRHKKNRRSKERNNYNGYRPQNNFVNSNFSSEFPPL